ncbi:MAG: hypothetical protein H7A27_07840 [Spirochaetaceae bacterium]|nr:hypothetical protein [Spirochaetaceae bacterium]
MKRRSLLIAACVFAAVTLSSCLPGDGKNTTADPAGFLSGFWHGVVAPVSLVVQIFKPEIRVYETANTGFWYDLGFWLALSGGAGGGAAAAGRRRRYRA